jgi:2-dehydropantoate 2-reductase
MRILTIGAGAVGTGLASAIAAAGHPVDVVARPRAAALLRASGLRRVGVLGEVLVPPERLGVYTSLATLPRQAYDFVLVSTKAYDAADVASELAACSHLVGHRTRIVLFFNGIGGHEIFAECFAREKIYAARLMTGFELEGQVVVKITVHGGPIAIGNPFTGDVQAVKYLCGLLTAGGLPSNPCPEILEEISAKLLFNCACNALGALFNLPIGGLAADPDSRRLMEQIVRETHGVMQPAGYRSRWGTPEEYFPVFYERLIPATAAHQTSMSQDLRAGKRTEIDFLNGAVANLGQRFGVAAPVNRLVTQAIKRLENRGPRDSAGTLHDASHLSAARLQPPTPAVR